tara:strand:- start:794 stop:1477 length:684 start_codon:yes stop_codon:yes gene_type:complete
MSKQNQGSESYTMPTEAQLKLVSASARRGVVASAKVSDAVRDCLRIVILENGDNVREAAVEELFARFYKANPRKTRYAVYMTLAQYKTKVGKLAKRVGWKAKMSEAFSVEGQRLETSLQFGVVKGGKGKTRGKKAAPKAKAGSLLDLTVNGKKGRPANPHIARSLDSEGDNSPQSMLADLLASIDASKALVGAKGVKQLRRVAHLAAQAVAKAAQAKANKEAKANAT